jgi:hypothetical protein
LTKLTSNRLSLWVIQQPTHDQSKSHSPLHKSKIPNQIHVTQIPKNNHFFIILLMGKLITTSKPLILKSKLLCFSLFYLFTTLFLALYTTLSQSKCFFRSSPSDPILNSLFNYPSSYGEHKYAVSTTRSTCSSPVFFSGNLQ